jgi:hypothetical protein
MAPETWTNVIPVIAAVIAAGAAITVATISVLSQRSARKSDELARRKQGSTDFHRRQLDELYGEMFLLRSTSRRLWTRLHDDDTNFRLIDNIAAIKGESSERRRRIVEQILTINARLANLIETRASLLTQLPPPESFMAFLDHQRALATLWEMGRNVEPGGREPSFPRSLDDDIKKALDSIQARLDELEK